MHLFLASEQVLKKNGRGHRLILVRKKECVCALEMVAWCFLIQGSWSVQCVTLKTLIKTEV